MLLLSVSGNKLELLTIVFSLMFLTKQYALPSRFYTSKQTSRSNGTVAATDYEMQVT
jgi:hypothetical protein